MKTTFLTLFYAVVVAFGYAAPAFAQQMVVVISPANHVLSMAAEIGAAAEANIVLANIGPAIGSVTLSGQNRSEFRFSDSASIDFGIADTVNIPVIFTPTVQGTVMDTIQFSGTLGTVTIVLVGTGRAGAVGSFIVNPLYVEIGPVLVGGTANVNIRVDNTSAATESFTAGTTLSAPFDLTTPTNFAIDAGQSAIVSVRFTPTTVGEFYDTLNIQNADQGTGVIVRGIALDDSDSLRTFDVGARVVDMGTVVIGADTTQSLLVVNNLITLQFIQMSLAIGTEFSIEQSGPLSVAGTSTATVNIRFRPTVEGTHMDTLLLTNGTTSIRVVLRGVGATAPPPTWNLTPSVVRFGPGVSGDVFTESLLVVNPTASTIIITNAAISGPDASDFTITNPVAYPVAIAAYSQFEIEVQSTLRDDQHASAAYLIVTTATESKNSLLIHVIDTMSYPRDTVRVRVENTSGLIGGTANVVVTLLSELPQITARAEITFEFNASVMAPIRTPLASVIEGGMRRVSFEFTPQAYAEGQVLMTEQFTLTLGDAETTPVSIVSLKLFDNADKEVKTVMYSNDALVSVEDARGRTVNANSGSISLQLSPNPATAEVTAKYASTVSPSHLTIYNSMGMIVADVSSLLPQSLEGTVAISLSTFASGTYLVRLSSESSTIVRTLVKH